MARRWSSGEPFVITSHPSPVPCKALASIACNHVFPRLSFSFLDQPLRYLGLVSLAYGAEPRLQLIFSAENPGGITKGEDSSPIDTRTLGEIREIGVPSRRRNIADDRNRANLKKRSDSLSNSHSKLWGRPLRDCLSSQRDQASCTDGGGVSSRYPVCRHFFPLLAVV